MFITLLCLGLIASAFAFIPGVDIRELQMTLASFFALSLGAVELYRNGFRPFKNKWVIIFLLYLPISVFIAPAPSITLVGINVTNFWSWQPIMNILIYSFMVFAISSHEFSKSELLIAIKTVVWCGFFMAFYVTLQRLDMDQFFMRNVDPSHGPSASYAGFIGNPTLVAPYIAMTVPFMIYLKKWWMIPVALGGVIFPESQMAYGGLFGGLAFLVGSKGKFRFVLMAVISFLVAAFLVVGYFNSPTVKKFITDHERFEIWSVIAKDVKNPIAKDVKNSYPLTGRGIGSFKFVHHVEHQNSFHQAHNDYLELTYGCGLAGLFFVFAAILKMIRENFSVFQVFRFGEEKLKSTLLASFVTIALTAFGTFVWQIGASIYLTCVLIGLLHNESLKLKTEGELA